MTIFDDLSDREIDTIKNTGTHVTLPADWSPIWEKTPADKAYIIVSGEASVRRRGEEIARLGEGDIFGESAIVNHALRSASIVTLTKLELIHFSREQVNRLREEIPAFGRALDRVAQDRLGTS
ncbi:cyclic nucleotide-binding domain-containing protein [Nocardioides euryhalodurans]|uniref:Cyclic nucleotide-binding domain-containing protein n=1 Tax=Nocardioides euryhalodurans TaxID=2518370 RepID=A0A4P7GLM2_9ACTN|nr:cyclic nucleotide-binding domain-containing protein [Nocardioides euryhalodurans]QBR92769.1 cyclic nucleotide-binding domain-containing protein [Nocardioides euryhalodurans]